MKVIFLFVWSYTAAGDFEGVSAVNDPAISNSRLGSALPWESAEKCESHRKYLEPVDSGSINSACLDVGGVIKPPKGGV